MTRPANVIIVVVPWQMPATLALSSPSALTHSRSALSFSLSPSVSLDVLFLDASCAPVYLRFYVITLPSMTKFSGHNGGVFRHISAITHPVWIDIGQKLIASFFAHRIYVARSAITPIEIHNRGASVGPVLYGIYVWYCVGLSHINCSAEFVEPTES